MATGNSAAFSACCTENDKQSLKQVYGGKGCSDLKGKPVEIGCFSLDNERQFFNDRSQMSYLEINENLSDEMNLNDGYVGRYIKREYNTTEGLESLLKWIKLNLDRFQNHNHKIDQAADNFPEKLPDFIMSRGKMAKIMCTPYENQEGWTMIAQKLGSTIYITEKATSESYSWAQDEDKQNKMTYWGWRFEKYMTRSDRPSKNPKPVDQTTVIVNNNAVFRTVLTLHLDSHSIVYSGEVDGYKEPKPGNNSQGNYIELKTRREFSTNKQRQNFHRYKTKNWWAQSYLAGIPEIICGFRDDNGTVVRISHFETTDLPKKAREVLNYGVWDEMILLSFLNKFFNEVKRAFQEHTRSSVILFSYKPGEKRIMIKTDDIQEHDFLPEWYITLLGEKGFIKE